MEEKYYEKNVVKKIITGLMAATMCLSLAACGNSAAAEVAETAGEQVAEVTEEVADEVAETAGEEEGMMSLEDQIKAVQDTLTFMGGLQTKDDADKHIDLSIFRNDQGDVVYIYNDGDIFDYGIFTTEESKTDDGRTYEKLIGTMGEYGYYFNEDLVSGIIIDQNGTVYDAVELTEDAARDYVSKTLGG